MISGRVAASAWVLIGALLSLAACSESGAGPRESAGPHSIIVHGRRSITGQADNATTNRLLKVDFDCGAPTTATTITVISTGEGRVHKYSVKSGSVMLRTATGALALMDPQEPASRQDLGALMKAIREELQGDLEDFDLSPEKERVAFTVYKRVEHDKGKLSSTAVYLYDLRREEMKELAPFGAVCEEPVFSPDGKQVAFYRAPLEIWSEVGGGVANDAHGHQLCVVNADGSGLRTLSPPPNTIYPGLPCPPAWSPDGRRILFVAQYNEPGKSADLILNGVYVADVKKGKIERLSPVGWGKGAFYPSWSPDGRRVCYTVHGRLTVQDLKTREARELPTDALVQGCVWSPDDDLIAFVEADTDMSPDFKLSIMSADGKFQLRHILSVENPSFHRPLWLR